MKAGPDYFTVTTSGGAIPLWSPKAITPSGTPVVVYTMQNVNSTITSIPVDARGAYNKTFQLVASFSTTMNVAIDGSLDPTCALLSNTASYFVIGNLSSTQTQFSDSRNTRFFRARVTSVAASVLEQFHVMYMYDDAG